MPVQPKVSVLLPVYNTKEEYLREAIDSILSQTFEDFELIIVNDCSTRQHVDAVVRSYTDGRVRYYLNEQNMGISPTRNKLVELSQGEYLAVMDHDDISLPDRLEKEVQYLDANPDIGVVSCQTAKGNRILHFPENDSDIRLSLVGTCVIMHPAAMIRKSVLIDNNIRYEAEFTPSEDYALWCRMLPHTKFHNLPEVLFRYRSHDTNTSKTQSEKMESTTLAIRSFVEAENPALYRKFLLMATHTARIKLFGYIPLLYIVSRGEKTTCFLFGKIPLLTWKKKIALKK